MKKLILNLILLFAFTVNNSVFSQTIEYDFNSKKFTSNKKTASKGETIQINVKNVNTLLYDVTVKVDTLTYNKKAPALFLQYFPTIDAIPSIIKSIENIGDKDEEQENGDQEFKAKLSKLSDSYVENLRSLKDRLVDISYNIALLRSPIINEVILANITKAKKSSLDEEIKKLYDELLNVDVSYYNYDGLYAKDSSIETLKLITLKNLADSLRKQINIDKIIGIWQMMDKSNFSFLSPPIYVDGDEMDIVVSIKPKSDSGSTVQAALKQETVTSKIDVINRKAISFSTGFFVTGLVDDSYASQANYNADTITNYSIVEENNSTYSMGPVALLHYSNKIAKNIALGVNLGVGVPIATSINPQFLFGGSVLWGTKDRLGINIHLTTGRVERLSNATNTDVTYSESPTVNTIKKWNTGIAVSLTYNFTP